MTTAPRTLALCRPLCVVDVESTGLDPQADRVVEVAVLKLHPDGTRRLGVRRLDPGVPVPAAATAVHGITDAALAGCPPFRDVAPKLAAFLADSDLLGFNLPFDLALLAAEFARAGVPFSLAGRACVDAPALFRRQHPHTLAGAVRAYLGRDHPAAHAAAGDVEATLAVFQAQLARDPALPRTPEGLHRLLAPVDVAGRFRPGPAGRPAFAFGKHRARPLAEVAATDPGYLRWLLRAGGLLPDAAALVHQAVESRE